MSQLTSSSQLPSISMDGSQTVVKVFLVNGESRSLRLDERTDVSVSPFLLGLPEAGIASIQYCMYCLKVWGSCYGVLITLLVLIQACHVVHFWDLHLIQVQRLRRWSVRLHGSTGVKRFAMK